MGAIHVHIHSSLPTRDKKVKVKDAKFVTKQAIRLPEDPNLGRWSGKIMEQGTVVYKEGSFYRPWFIKNGFRIQIPSSALVAETLDEEISIEQLKSRVRALERRAQQYAGAGGLPRSHPIKQDLTKAREQLKEAERNAKREVRSHF